MIKITSIINMIEGFNHNKYAEHQREEYLLTHGYYQNKEGRWFNRLGQLAGVNEVQTCDNDLLPYPILNPIDYYAITDKEASSLLKKKEPVHKIKNVRVWVSNARTEA